MRVLLVLAAWLIWGGCSKGVAQDGGAPLSSAPALNASEQDELARRVKTLLERAREPAVRSPAEQAQLSLERARRAGDAQARERALAIARAALALADAREALLRERELFASARQRRREAELRARREQQMLAELRASARGAAADGGL